MQRPTREYLARIVEEYGDRIRDEGWGGRRLKRATGLSRRQVRRVIRWAKEGMPTQASPRNTPAEGPKDAPKEPTVTVEDEGDACRVNVRGQALVMNIDDLVEVADIDVSEWTIARHRVNTWTTTLKNADGEPEIVRNWQVRADLERRFVVDVAEPSWTPVRRIEPDEHPMVESALIIPDSQHGFRWTEDRRRLEPLHDRRACDIAVQVARELQPQTIVLLGDMLDVAEWSTRYPRPSELRDTTQPTLLEVHWWLRDLRETCPTARILYLEGNHEDRITRALIDSMPHAAGLTAVGDTEPVLSVPRLLGLDALDIEYVGPYGASAYLWDHVRVTHGDKVRAKGGATSRAVVAEATEPTLFGHVHRVEYAARTLHERDGARVVWAATPGCLCRVDGSVPGVTARPDWQQGLGIVQWDGLQAHYSQIQIEQGRAMWRGRLVEGVDRGEEIAEAIGWPQAG